VDHESREQNEQVVFRLNGEAVVENDRSAVGFRFEIEGAAEFRWIMVMWEGVIGFFVDHAPAIFDDVIHSEVEKIRGKRTPE